MTPEEHLDWHWWHMTAGLQANSTIAVAVAAIEVFMWIYGLNLYRELPPQTRKGLGSYLLVGFLMMSLSCINATTSSMYSFGIIFETSGSKSMENIHDVIDRLENSVVDHVESFTLVAQRWIGDALIVFRCYIIWKDRIFVHHICDGVRSGEEGDECCGFDEHGSYFGIYCDICGPWEGRK
ncbi:hypothetical protein CC2G_014452 [Coprinopsis cinerea AmutBmut pab1-1]|nr:hypothetical protein CC2G_014452 [Coprinopsis cinerea AmutBmut pab1-1]